VKKTRISRWFLIIYRVILGSLKLTFTVPLSVLVIQDELLPVDVLLTGGGDEVVVLSCLKLKHTRHRGEGSEWNCKKSKKNTLLVLKWNFKYPLKIIPLLNIIISIFHFKMMIVKIKSLEYIFLILLFRFTFLCRGHHIWPISLDGGSVSDTYQTLLYPHCRSHTVQYPRILYFKIFEILLNS